MRSINTSQHGAVILLWGAMGLLGGLGCDSRSLPPSEDTGRATDSMVLSDQHVSSPDQSAPRRDSGEMMPQACVIAIQLKDCCPQPMPALRQDVEQDPCLVPFPNHGDYPEHCSSSLVCPDVACLAKPPRSRLVEAVPGGGCAWKSECETVQGCTSARNVRSCCSCIGAFPTGMVEQDPCLMPEEMRAYPPPGCDSYCDRSDSMAGCEPCPPSEPLACVAEDPGDPSSLKRCEPYSLF